MKRIDIIIPIFNEKENISILFEEVQQLKLDQYFFHLIFVNDGSSDESEEEVLKLKEKFQDQVTLINFSRNFGHQSALTAGLKYSKDAKAVITMDADLQHPPRLIPKILEQWENGSQIVYTVRSVDVSLSVLKKVSSELFYKLINRLSSIYIPPGAADFRLWDKQVLKEFQGMKEKNIFLRGISPWLGFQQSQIEYTPDQRKYGKTKYDLKKMLVLALDGITSFSSFPLYLSSFIGFFFFIIGCLWGMRVIYIKIFTNQSIQGWASIIISIILIGGIQILLLGIIGIYLGKIHQQIKDRPDYVIKSIK